MKQKQNKKRIKNVPRYALAGSTPLPNKIVPNAAVQAYINQGTQNSLNAAGQRIAAQQAGAPNIGGAVQGALGATQLIAGLGQRSTAATNSEVMSQSITDIGQGMSAGMQVGSMFGPVGAGIGAAAGTVLGAIGKSGGIKQTEGFTEDNKYTLSTGLKGLFGNRRLKRKIAQDKRNIADNRFAVSATERMQNEYAEDNTTNAYSFVNGGVMPSDLAYVDDGEVIKTPNGNINYVPEEGKPTDSNLVNIPGGSTILSDKIKVPGTNKTFAEVAKKNMSKRISKNKDRFAENSRMLNERNDMMMHDQLFALQEAIKTKGNNQQKFEKGGVTKKVTFDKLDNVTPNTGPLSVKQNQSNSILNNSTQNQSINLLKDSTFIPGLGLITKNASSTTKAPTTTSSVATTTAATTTSASKPGTDIGSTKSVRNISNKVNELGTSIAAVLPALGNIFTSDSESVAPVTNPYEQSIVNTMRRRRFNITPALEQLRNARAIANYNAGQYNTNTGANMALRTQMALGTNRSIADLYLQQSNVQNQYDAEYANTLNSLGQQNVSAINLAQDINARNTAATRNIRRTGLSQLGQYAQVRQQMANMQNRDKAIMPFLSEYLNAGYSSDMINNLLKYYN